MQALHAGNVDFATTSESIMHRPRYWSQFIPAKRRSQLYWMSAVIRSMRLYT